ncbi:hypothetical protein MTQ10_07320 [Streptomyces sp. XM83C]|uniref:hypothetical protein n=1 Tax=unclassified Streptomyces TaxID=2593676 RepID=UPI001FF72946|nr:hypothetical protein [Streptomyces sp. XM83C]MCK1819422.1 hypothetical protein [Streptomyces sp. XM83C]
MAPVTADDVAHAVRLALDALREVPADRWGDRAGSLEWDRWETVEHLANDLLYYSVQLGPQSPPLDTHVPFALHRKRPDGPMVFVFAERGAGPAGLLQVLEACCALLVAMVRTTSPRVRAHHASGVSDPEGFAAMGVVETLVHTHDVAEGLGLDWTPPSGLCSRALTRLFPDVPDDTDPWRTLLWATGRAELPGRPRRAAWRWAGAPRG